MFPYYYPVDIKNIQVQKPTYQLKIEYNDPVSQRFTWDMQDSWLNATDASERLKQSVKELTRLHSALSALYFDDDYDDDFLRPTGYAIIKTKLLLAKINNLSGLPSRGHVSTDGTGGFRIVWSVGEKSVRLVIADNPSGKSYIYYEDTETYGSDRNISPDAVSKWLKWLFD